MESKKESMFAALMEDDSDGPGAAYFRSSSSSSPFPPSRSLGDGESGITALELNPFQESMSCVYVLFRFLSLHPQPSSP